MQRYFGENAPSSQFSPIWGNRNFPPGTDGLGFKFWGDRSISKILDLCENDNPFSFNEVKQKFSIDSKQFFKVSSDKKLHKKDTELYKTSLPKFFRKTVLNHYGAAGLISKFYQIIIAAGKESS